jgi:hypothetical protein
MSDAGQQNPQPGQASSANGVAPPWYATLDDVTKGTLQNTGLDKLEPVAAVAKAVQMFRDTQAKLGIPAANVLRLPTDPTDAAAWKVVHERLGVPPDPSGYDFSTVKFADGAEVDAGFAAFMRDTAARLNIPKDAAAQLAAAFIKFGEDAESAETVQAGTAMATAQMDLATSWGANAEANKFVANRTAGMLGFTPEDIAALSPEKYGPFMQKMLEAGNRMGEAPLLGNAPTGGGQRILTREGAVARIEELKNDRSWWSRYNSPNDPGHKAAVDEWTHLNRLASSRPR